jgi:hypothetical protein
VAETYKVIKQDFILHFYRKTLSSLFYFFLDFPLNSYDLLKYAHENLESCGLEMSGL